MRYSSPLLTRRLSSRHAISLAMSPDTSRRYGDVCRFPRGAHEKRNFPPDWYWLHCRCTPENDSRALSGSGHVEDHARLFLKAEIKRADLTYEELAERLKKHGFTENSASIANKLARGTFSATFMIAVMKAMGCNTLDLEQD